MLVGRIHTPEDYDPVIEAVDLKSTSGGLSMLLLSMDDAKKFSTKQFCCHQQDVTDQKCKATKATLFENLSEDKRTGTTLPVAIPGTAVQHTVAGGKKSNVIASTLKVSGRNVGGFYYIILADCSEEAGLKRVSGEIRVKHKHGYLSEAGKAAIGLLFITAIAFSILTIYSLFGMSTWAPCHKSAFWACFVGAVGNLVTAACLHIFNDGGIWPPSMDAFVSPSAAAFGVPYREILSAFRNAIVFAFVCMLLRAAGYCGAPASFKEKFYCVCTSSIFFAWQIQSLSFNQETAIYNDEMTVGAEIESPDSPTLNIPMIVLDIVLLLPVLWYLARSVHAAKLFSQEQAGGELEAVADMVKKFTSAFEACLVLGICAYCMQAAARYIITGCLKTLIANSPASEVLNDAKVIPSDVPSLSIWIDGLCTWILTDFGVLLICYLTFFSVSSELVSFQSIAQQKDVGEDIEMVGGAFSAPYEEESREVNMMESRVWADEGFDDDEVEEGGNSNRRTLE